MITIEIGPPHDPRHPCYFCDGQTGIEGAAVEVFDRDTTLTEFSVCPDCLTCAPDQLAARAVAKDRPFRPFRLWADARDALATDLPILRVVAEWRAHRAQIQAQALDEDDLPF